jgi:hypothetical protein
MVMQHLKFCNCTGPPTATTTMVDLTPCPQQGVPFDSASGSRVMDYCKKLHYEANTIEFFLDSTLIKIVQSCIRNSFYKLYYMF